MLTKYLTLLITTMVAGLAVLLYGQRVPILTEFDLLCIRAVSPPEDRVYELDQKTQTIFSYILTTDRAGLPLHIIEVTDDPGKIYESSPPSPLDYAVMLHTLHEQGAENIVLTTRMSWDGDLGITAEALSNKLSAFPRACIPLPLTRGSTPQDLPKALSQSIIPFSNLKGNQASLPIVNQVAIPAIVSDTGNTYAGFSEIESLPRNQSTIPLICIWQDQGIIPSLELLALMTTHKTKPDEVIIHCGKHIRLGSEGPIIPIGNFGEIPLPETTDLSTTSTTKAEDLITSAKEKKEPAIDKTPVYLIHAVGEKTQITNAIPTGHIAAITHWSTSLPTPASGSAIQYPRLTLWIEIFVLFVISLLAYWFANWSKGSRHLGFLLTLIMLYPLLHILIKFPQHWMSLSAPLIALIITWLIPVNQLKRSSSITKKTPKERKPDIHAPTTWLF